MILPRAWPRGRPPLSVCACSLRMRTLWATTSSCMQDLVWILGSPSGFGRQCGHSSRVKVCRCCCRSMAMLIVLTGLAATDIDRTCWALLLNGVSPLVTIQRSAQNSGLDDALANLIVSSLAIGSPLPCSSSWRDLHWMAICWRSLRRMATASIPTSTFVVSGKWYARSGHCDQR